MTTKKIQDLCRAIIGFPRTMHQKRNVSIYSLVKESGYFEMHEQITVEAIRQALLKYPGRVNDWLQHSEDKRCDSGWFFQQNGTDYEVGFYSSKADAPPPSIYRDRLTACATFIKHETEEIRLID